MKTLISILMLCITFSISPNPLQAQDQNDQRYVVAEYMKVKPGMWDQYLACEKVWKKIHAFRVEKGHIVGWELEQVMLPSGTANEYDFLTLTHFKNWDSMDQNGAWWEEAFATLTDEEKEIANAAEQYRDLIRREIWTAGDFAFRKDMDSNPKYRVENFMKLPPAGWSAWASLESDFVKPVHEKNIEKGNRAGWVMGYMVYPRGANMEYDCSTVDFYDSWDQMDNNEGEAWQEVYPDIKWDELDQKIENTRTLVRTEVRMITDYVWAE